MFGFPGSSFQLLLVGKWGQGVVRHLDMPSFCIPGPPEETEDCWELSKQPLVPASLLLFSGLLSGERMVVEWCPLDMGHRWPEPHACLPIHLSQTGPRSHQNSTSSAAFSVMGCESIYGMTKAGRCPLPPPGVACPELSGQSKSSWPH